MADADDLIVVAHIVKTRGLRGEVVADLLTDFPERFQKLTKLIGVATSGVRRSLEIEEQWFHGDRIVFKFAGFDRIEEAKELVGYDLAIPSEERVSLPKNSFYEWELAGCRVETIDGAKIGDVKEIMRTGGVEMGRLCAGGVLIGRAWAGVIGGATTGAGRGEIHGSRVEEDRAEEDQEAGTGSRG